MRKSATEGAQAVAKGLARASRGFLHDRLTLLAIVFLFGLGITVAFAHLSAPYGFNEQDLLNRLKPPLSLSTVEGSRHWLGTDALGRDVLSRIIFGGRVSLTVGLLSVALSGTFGVSVGLLAGFYRGRLDDIISRLMDLMIAFPSILAAMFVLFIVGPGFWNVVLVLALVRWHVYARIIRGMTMSLREAPFIQGARTIGCSNRRIIVTYIVPNLMSSILVIATLEVALAIVVEASLSFLGFGVQPPTPSWGLEIAGSRAYLRSAWWLVAFPGLAIFMTTLSLNISATWLRTVSDPAQRWRWVMAGGRASRGAS